MRTRTEIGSEFWEIPLTSTSNRLFAKDTEWFLSGRVALYRVIAHIKAQQALRTVAMPSWCCETMILPFLKNGVEVRFYPVYFENGELQQDLRDVADCDACLVMDYFGYQGRSLIRNLPSTIIRDVTHSLLRTSWGDGDYIFGSLRKWAGFWTGGFVQSKKGAVSPCVRAEDAAQRYASLRREAMRQKREYITLAREDKGYLSVFGEAERELESITCGGADVRDIQAAHAFDVERIRQRRRENATYLLKELSALGPFGVVPIFSRLSEDDCPLFVPILVSGGRRDALRRYLIEREIYCPVHWPVSKIHGLTDVTRRIYDEELSLLCDQRYRLQDMRRIIDAIRKFFEE